MRCVALAWRRAVDRFARVGAPGGGGMMASHGAGVVAAGSDAAPAEVDDAPRLMFY